MCLIAIVSYIHQQYTNGLVSYLQLLQAMHEMDPVTSASPRKRLLYGRSKQRLNRRTVALYVISQSSSHFVTVSLPLGCWRMCVRKVS